MALLQIAKKAISPDDAQKLVEATFSLRNPLGVPTIFFQPHEFDQAKNIKDILAIVNPRLQAFSASPEFAHIYSGKEDVFSAHADTGYVRTLLRYVHTGETMPECRPLTHRKFTDFADRYARREYIQPLYNVVIAGNSLQQDFMKGQNVELPFSLHFLSEWHEIAHGTGAGEPQADLMSGCVTMKAFEDPRIIIWQADKRAYDAVNLADNPMYRERFGWAVVDANDYLAAQDQKRVLGLNEEQIRAMRFVHFQSLSETLQRVSQAIIRREAEMAQSGSKTSRVEAIMDLAQTEFKDDPAASYMTKRFALARLRLPRGLAGYTGQLAGRIEPPGGKYPSLIDEPELPPPS